MGAIELGGIIRYEGYPCNHTLCQNDAVCIPVVNSFKCNLFDSLKMIFNSRINFIFLYNRQMSSWV